MPPEERPSFSDISLAKSSEKTSSEGRGEGFRVSGSGFRLRGLRFRLGFRA